MLKNKISIFFGIFLVSMLFVPPSMPAVEAQDSEIPGWIKNNAGWWADEQIDDASFLKGIEYLVDNLIIQIPPNQQITPNSGLLQLDKFAYELPKRSGTTEVNVSGKFENWSGASVSIEITRPDGKIDNISTRSTTGSFESVYVIKSDFPLGNYQLSAKSVNVQLGVVSFKLNAQSDQPEKSIPTWIRNNAGWWAEGQIDDSSFVSGLQFLIKEGIIKVQQKKIDKNASFAPGIDENLIMYHTKLPAAVVSKGVFSAIVIHATHNDYCSNEENKITAAYGKMTEIGLKKNIRNDPVQVLAVCMKLDVIKENSYPLVLKELGANRSNVMIFIGDIEANFESYIIKEALGWWRCEADYTSKWAFQGCGTHIIVVCDECTRPDLPDNEDVTARGMETLVHEIGHHNLFEAGFGGNVFGGSLHNAQDGMDYCREGGVLESNMCKKLIESIPIMGKTYPVMNLIFLKSNWKEIDRIAEGDKITNWIDCKISNYENGITGICGPGITTTEDSSEDNVQYTQRDFGSEQKVPESIQNLYVKNPRIVNEFGASVAKVTVGQQVQIAVDATNKQDRYQAFAYVVQTQDDKGILVSDAWITGTLNAGQSISPALAWTPKAAGHYTTTIYLYETMKNRILLAEPLTLEINVVGSSVLVPSSPTLPYFGAIVELDKVYYSPVDDVNIVITAPNFNTNSNVIEYIGTDTDSRVTITTSEGYLDFYKLKETFPDSGVFTGSVSLKGQYALSGGTGPWSGKIKASNQDTITVKFTNTYSGKADTAAAQGFVQGGLDTVPTTSFKKFNDFRQKFTIEYPDDWVLAEGHPDSKAAFDDQYDWRTNFQVFLIEDDSLNNRSDSKVLRAMERNHWEACKDETFADGTRKCSDFKAVDSDVFHTNDNRKVYFVKSTYTMEFSDYLRGQEHSFVKVVGLIYDGDHSWVMNVESYEQVADAHYDEIIHMMKSFSLK